MIDKVTAFRSRDGKLHKSEIAAAEHELALWCSQKLLKHADELHALLGDVVKARRAIVEPIMKEGNVS